MSDSAVLTERYQKALKRREAVVARSQKIETAREITAAKIKDQEARIKALGVDPDKVDEWLVTESARIDAELRKTESDLDEAERVLTEIESDLKNLNG